MNSLRNFGFLLRDVSRLSSRNFERHASQVKLGLNLVQCKVLIYLERNQGMPQVRLADLTDTEPMTLVRILDRMEQDGWIERRSDPSDRRVRRLYLRPPAIPVVKRILTLADRARAESLSGLDLAEREVLFGLLTRIHLNLSGLVPADLENGPHNGNENARKKAAGISRPDQAARTGLGIRARTRSRSTTRKAAP